MGADETPVFLPGLITEAPAPLSSIALNPLVQKLQERDIPLRCPIASVELQPFSRREGAGDLLLLLATDVEHGDVVNGLAIGVNPSVDPGNRGFL